MSRKPKRGYFVRGQFVAEGSELDLEYKRELRGGDAPTRTELKRESEAMQTLGESLLDLRSELFDKLELPQTLVQAVQDVRRIRDFEGRRRQMQYIGKLMRQLEPETVQAIRSALDVQHHPSAQQTLLLHTAEQWRDRMLADDSALQEWLSQHPQSDSQQLRAWVRQARKDAKPEPVAGQAQRQGRAYRELFQHLRSSLEPLLISSSTEPSNQDTESDDQ